MPDTSLFGRRLSELRKGRGLSKTALGKIIGVSITQISEMERGTSATTMQRLIQLCDYFGVSSDYLLGLTDDMRPRTPVLMSSAAPEMEPAPWMPLEEFQEYTETHEGSWELINGMPVKMDSGSDAHQWLCLELGIQLGLYFRGKSCAVLPEKDIWASTGELTDTRDKRKDATRKPDLLVYCSKAQSVHNLIVKPELVIEVWSPGNSNPERAGKQALYQALGIKELWLIDSVTRDFTILSFQNLHIPEIEIGNVDKDRLESFLFPGLSVDLSGLQAYLDNFSNS